MSNTLELIHSVATFSSLYSKFNNSMREVLSSIKQFNAKNIKTYDAPSNSLESFIKETWLLREHTITQLKAIDKNEASIFTEKLRNLYDVGISYALIYKLRNYIEHHSRLPLSVENENHFYLRSKDLIDVKDEHGKDIFNKKTKDYFYANEKINIVAHISDVYFNLSNLIKSTLDTR